MSWRIVFSVREEGEKVPATKPRNADSANRVGRLPEPREPDSVQLTVAAVPATDYEESPLEGLFALGDRWAQRHPVDLEALNRLLAKRPTGPIRLDGVTVNVEVHLSDDSRNRR